MDLEAGLALLRKRRRTWGIPGGGKMGVGIATVAIACGDRATVYEAAPARIPLIRGEIEKRSHFLAENELIDPERAVIPEDSLVVTDTISDLIGVSLVIEAITEKKPTKFAFYRELCAILPDYVIIGSNTSSISIAQLAQAVSNPERFLGIHFLNPADVCPETEIVSGTHADSHVIEAVVNLFRGLGRWPIRIQGNVGLINLQQASLLDTAMRMEKEQGEGDEVLTRINQLTMRLGQWLVEDGLFSDTQAKGEDAVYLRLRTSLIQRGRWLIDRGFAVSEADVAMIAKALGRRWKVVGLFGGADLGGLVVFKELYQILAPILELVDPLPDLLSRRVNAGHRGWKGKTRRGILPCPEDTAAIEAKRDNYALEVIKSEREP